MAAGNPRGRRLAPSEAVLGLVETCGRRAALAHVARVLCLAGSVALLVLALVVARGRSVLDAEALFLAFLVGALGFTAWVRSVRFDAPLVARRIDRAFPASGLLASFEAARSGERTDLRELAALRAYRAVPVGRALERTVPVAVPFIVLPLAGAAGLVFAVEWRDAHASGPSHVLSLETLSGDLGALGSTPGTALDPELEAEVAALAAEVDAALAAARGGGGAEEARAAREWARTLEDLAEEADGELADTLRELAFDAEWIAPASEAGGDEVPEQAADSVTELAAEAGTEGHISSGREAGDGGAERRPASAGEAVDGSPAGRSQGAGTQPAEAGGAAPGGDGGGDAGATARVTPPDGAASATVLPNDPPSAAPAVAGPPPVPAPARHAAIVRVWLESRGR